MGKLEDGTVGTDRAAVKWGEGAVGGVVIGWLDGQVFPVEGENIAQANI